MRNHNLAINILIYRPIAHVVLAIAMVVFLIQGVFFRLCSTYFALPASGRAVDADIDCHLGIVKRLML